MGAVNIVSALIGISRERLYLLMSYLPLEMRHGTRTLNRVPREGYSAVWYELAQDPNQWLGELTAISQSWLRAQHGEEKGFSMGTWELARQFSHDQRLLVLRNPRRAHAVHHHQAGEEDLYHDRYEGNTRSASPDC